MDEHKERDEEELGKKSGGTVEQSKQSEHEEENQENHHTDFNGQEKGHDHDHAHMHTHPHQNTKAVINRLSRAIGHLTMVKKMVEEGRDCSEVLIQLAAVKSALNSTGKVILKDHLEHCMVDAIESGDMKEIEALNQAIDQFIK